MLNNTAPFPKSDRRDTYHLDPYRFVSQLKPLGRRAINRLTIVDSIDSTNDYLINQKDASTDEFSICIAAQQNKGRGRRGKKWSSPAGGNIYLSLAWKAKGVDALEHWYGLMIALALAQYLSGLSVSFVGVKWPNDLYCNGRKLGGILLERVGDTYVSGVGLNVVSDESGMSDVITECISLKDIGVNLKSYSDIVASATQHICAAIDSTEQQTPQRMQKLLRPFDLLYAKQITVEKKDGALSGVAAGVDEQGLLKLKTSRGLVLCGSSECSVRL